MLPFLNNFGFFCETLAVAEKVKRLKPGKNINWVDKLQSNLWSFKRHIRSFFTFFVFFQSKSIQKQDYKDQKLNTSNYFTDVILDSLPWIVGGLMFGLRSSSFAFCEENLFFYEIKHHFLDRTFLNRNFLDRHFLD